MALKFVTPKGDRFGETLSIEFAGKSVDFHTGTYSKSTFNDLGSLFTPLNGYLAHLPTDRQRSIFNVYEQCMEVLYETENSTMLADEMQDLIKELYDLLDIEEMRRWLSVHVTFTFQQDLPVEYSPGRGSRDMTYTRSEYAGLLFLATVLKPMIPIFGQYIKIIGRQEKTRRELYAFQFLGRSTVMQLEEMKRLEVYVAEVAAKPKRVQTAVHAGLSSQALPRWFLAEVVVRKLPLGEVTGNSTSLITTIYRMVMATNDSMDRKFGETVRDKTRPHDNRAEEDNISVPENYGMREEISGRLTVSCSHYAIQYPDNLAKRICPDHSKSDFQAIMRFLHSAHPEINEVAVAFTGLIVDDHIPARMLRSLEYNAILNLVGVAVLKLKELEALELIPFMTGQFKPYGLDDIPASIEGGGCTTRPPKKLVVELAEYYPYFPGRKPAPASIGSVAGEQIGELITFITSNHWRYNSPEILLPKGKENGDRLKPHPKLAATFAETIIKILKSHCN